MEPFLHLAISVRRHSAITLSLLLFACSHAQIPLPQTPRTLATDSRAELARGEYLVRNAGVCGGCHAASERDPDGPLSGGREFHDWRIGTARASNLTPDDETGLGKWSEPQIVRALRNGQDDEGRLLAPVMPYEWLHGMSDDDAFAVARYLKSLPPVRNQVEQSPSIWFRLGKLFLGPKPAASIAAPARAATPEYGGYLAQHAALCTDCHTPRVGVMSKPDRSRLFAGMANPPAGFPANPSNLTPDATGIANWTEADFINTMRSGVNPSGVHLHPFMPWQQNKRMTDDDLRAIYRYLRTLPPIHNEVPRKTTG